MASVNKVILIGNLGRDPETRHTADGAAITNISLATTRRYKDSSGQQQEETEWHRVAFFGRLAEIAGEYLRKGRPVYVEGRLRTRKWQDKETVRIATRPRSSPRTCRCWARARAWAALRMSTVARSRVHRLRRARRVVDRPPRNRRPTSPTWTTTFRSDAAARRRATKFFEHHPINSSVVRVTARLFAITAVPPSLPAGLSALLAPGLHLPRSAGRLCAASAYKLEKWT